ncbi:alpha/beta fold hydrolase [Caulobacter sp. NIBR2454]|uniref:alpha/beta fold hydrolase n=1 Tax=Caulobacter sp. NIBR2454 TaxID=3015996 RepID=UPI0022B6955F|nr:alpha/beta fold hydrolase [Caulobacter sp. NIBR2454]
MLSFTVRAAACLSLAFVAWIALGGAMSIAAPQPRGKFYDVGGRNMRLVCEGPATGSPTVLLEAGAFGFAADWGAVQEALTAQGIRSCAYDRAGMGYSDPGPLPRDGNAIEGDLEKLLAAAGEKGPFVLVGHSMAGMRMPLFAASHADAVVGVVLVDAASPSPDMMKRAETFVRTFVAASRWAARGAALGLYKPLKGTRLGDKIGLPPQASAEKRWAFADKSHNRTAAREVEAWRPAAEQALAAPPYPKSWPVAAVTAGALTPGARAEWKKAQSAPAEASEHGYVRHVEGASHNSLLGRKYAHEIVKAVQFVIANG